MSNLLNISSDRVQQMRIEREKESILERERDLEEANIAIMALKKEDVCFTDEGKEMSRSLNLRLANFLKEMTENERKQMLWFIDIETTMDKFIEYLQEKYKKGALKKFNQLVTRSEFKRDIRNLIVYEIYNHKMDLFLQGSDDGFQSMRAYRSIAPLMLQKKFNTDYYKAIGATRKNAAHILLESEESEFKFTTEQEKQLAKIFLENAYLIFNFPSRELERLYDPSVKLLSKNENKKKLGGNL